MRMRTGSHHITRFGVHHLAVGPDDVRVQAIGHRQVVETDLVVQPVLGLAGWLHQSEDIGLVGTPWGGNWFENGIHFGGVEDNGIVHVQTGQVVVLVAQFAGVDRTLELITQLLRAQSVPGQFPARIPKEFVPDENSAGPGTGGGMFLQMFAQDHVLIEDRGAGDPVDDYECPS